MSKAIRYDMHAHSARRTPASIDAIPLRDRDHALTADLTDLLAAHRLLHKQHLTFVVSGGVVHLRGSVASDDARRTIRKVISRLRGIHAVWDTLTIAGQDQPRIADIGCGSHKQIPWATGVDKHPVPGVDILADLESGLPFRDGELDQIYAIHIFEHVRDLVSLMNEVHRCLKPGGVLHVMVPDSRSANAIADPTHVRLFNRQTFRYFCTATPRVLPFRPLIVSGDRFNIVADLEPVQKNEPMPDEVELARWFE